MAQPTEDPRETGFLETTKDIHIAIVDDDLLFGFMLQDYLIETGRWNSEIFSNGVAFLKKYKSKDPRIIILDYEFAEGPDGLAVLQKIKKVNPSAKVIIVSGLDDLEKALEMIRNGAVDYFLKFNTTVFNNIVCSINKLHELEKQKLN
ncbi:MAG TPA: response regulator [Bacteroidia bacterium]|nr:response regulator [Bacteroidia bacterium]